MRLKEIQDYFKVPRTCAYKLMQDKEFPSTKINGRWEIDRKCLLKWIEDRIRQKGNIYGTKTKQG